MKSFIQYILESKKLFRFDDLSGIPQVSKFAFSPDKHESGNAEHWNPPKNWKIKTGLFAGDMKNVILYSVPRETRWIQTKEKKGKKSLTIYFDKSDRKKIEDHISTLSKYDEKQGFEKTVEGSGEYFITTKKAPQPLEQEKIENPLRHIAKYYNIIFVDDIKKYIKDLKRKKIKFNSEGDFEST